MRRGGAAVVTTRESPAAKPHSFPSLTAKFSHHGRGIRLHCPRYRPEGEPHENPPKDLREKTFGGENLASIAAWHGSLTFHRQGLLWSYLTWRSQCLACYLGPGEGLLHGISSWQRIKGTCNSISADVSTLFSHAHCIASLLLALTPMSYVLFRPRGRFCPLHFI